MAVYRSWWSATVTVLALASFVAGAASMGWPAFLGATTTMCLGGVAVGLAWVEDSERRSRTIRDSALWFWVGSVLVLGLPTLLGPWSLAVWTAVAVPCPSLVERFTDRRRAHRTVRTRHQVEQLQDRDLERRWLRTGQELRRHRDDAAAVLALAAERAMLLDELERRDPVGFEALLVRAGWREPQDRR